VVAGSVAPGSGVAVRTFESYFKLPARHPIGCSSRAWTERNSTPLYLQRHLPQELSRWWERNLGRQQSLRQQPARQLKS
jgi:hypothetical protein